jgi:hypothetical protein
VGWSNNALEPTPNSLRSCVAPAIGRGSPRALGTTGAGATPAEGPLPGQEPLPPWRGCCCTLGRTTRRGTVLRQPVRAPSGEGGVPPRPGEDDSGAATWLGRRPPGARPARPQCLRAPQAPARRRPAPVRRPRVTSAAGALRAPGVSPPPGSWAGWRADEGPDARASLTRPRRAGGGASRGAVTAAGGPSEGGGGPQGAGPGQVPCPTKACSRHRGARFVCSRRRTVPLPGAGEAQRSGLHRPGLGLPHIGGEGEPLQPGRFTGGPRWPQRGSAGRQQAHTRGVECPGGGRLDPWGAGARTGVGAADRACGWVARGAPGRTEQPLAPDPGERGAGGAAAARYRSPVPVKPSVRPLSPSPKS